MKTTRHFEEQVLRKRPYLRRAWCREALENPLCREIEPNERVRHWILVEEEGRYLRGITLADGETVNNAFFDRRFKEEP